MHPLNDLFVQCQILDAGDHMEGLFGIFSGTMGLLLAKLLDQRYSVAALLSTFSREDRLFVAGYHDILFTVEHVTIFHEDGDIICIISTGITHSD